MALQNLKPGTIVGDRYRIERPLGHGAMGIVYLATHRELGTSLAIKFLDQAAAGHAETTERFRREGRAAVAIAHPGIVKMVDLDTTPDGVRYLVMEYLEGLTLSDLLERVGVLRPAVASAVLVPMLEALEAAHTAGVIHRDLKPANVMLSTAPNQAVKLLDFGISKVTRDPRLTTPGQAMGTPDYMAPEQTMDAQSVTAASDLYALGTMAFEMLSGRLPFISPNVAEMMFKVLKEPPPKLASVTGEIHPRLSELVDALLAKEPMARPQSAAGVRKALVAAVPPDTAALWALVKAPDAAAFAPTFARPSPATPQQLAQLARTMPADGRVPEPALPPGVPRRSVRPTGIAPEPKKNTRGGSLAPTERVQPIAPPKRSSLPLVLGSLVMLLAGAGGLYISRAPSPGPRAPSKAAPELPLAPVARPVEPPPAPVAPPPAPVEPPPAPVEPVVVTPPPPEDPPVKPPPLPRKPPAPKKSVEARLLQEARALLPDDPKAAKKKLLECMNVSQNADCLAELVTVHDALGESKEAQKAQRQLSNLRSQGP